MVRITCTSATVAVAVDDLFDAFPSATGADDAGKEYAIVDGCASHGNDRCAHADAEAVDVSGPPGVALSWLLRTVNHAALDGFGCLAIHAGVLASGQSVIAFPAPSGTGKTTLAAAGLLAGFDYVSDEALCVEPGGEVLPYPRALALSSRSRRVLGLDETAVVALDEDEAAVPPGRLGAAVPGPPLRVAHVVELVRRREGPQSACVLVPAGRADAMTWLLQRSFNHYKHPDEAFQRTAELVRAAGAWRLEYGDPLEAAALLRDRLT